MVKTLQWSCCCSVPLKCFFFFFFYRPRSRGDNTFGSVCVFICLSVCLSVCPKTKKHSSNKQQILINCTLCTGAKRAIIGTRLSRVQHRTRMKHKSIHIYHYYSKAFGLVCVSVISCCFDRLCHRG